MSRARRRTGERESKERGDTIITEKTLTKKRALLWAQKRAVARRFRRFSPPRPLPSREAGGVLGEKAESVARRRGIRGEKETRDHRRHRTTNTAGEPLTRGGCLSRRQIVKTKPESQWIVITRPLYHLQQPVSYSSRLQVIHRPGSGNCDRSRLMQYGCAWLPPGGKKRVFRHGF